MKRSGALVLGGGRGWAEEASRTKCFGIRIVPSAAEMYF